jgi:hypothetical protein
MTKLEELRADYDAASYAADAAEYECSAARDKMYAASYAADVAKKEYSAASDKMYAASVKYYTALDAYQNEQESKSDS